MTHWIRVTVLVPVRTTRPSPTLAELDALKAVQQVIREPMRVTDAEWSRTEQEE